MNVAKHPITERLERLEKRRTRNKTKEDLREFVLLVLAIATASFVHDGLLKLINYFGGN